MLYFARIGKKITGSSGTLHVRSKNNPACLWQVLRTAGYHWQALWVAEAAGEADWVLDILMEDLAAYDDALALLVGAGRVGGLLQSGWTAPEWVDCSRARGVT